MSRAAAMAYLVGRITHLGMIRVQILDSSYSTMVQAQMSNQSTARAVESLEQFAIQSAAFPFPKDDGRCNNQVMYQYSDQEAGGVCKRQIGENISRKDKINFLISTLVDLKDSKEAVYGALDAWVAWEQNFPIASLKMALLALEKEQQWHRIVQVIKWMLSKGQGTTTGTYGQLIKALDMDHRAEEAHRFWMKKIGSDLHSVPWQICKLMISIYYRNNMLESLVKLFKGLEAFDRKPPEKSVVQKVANAYEMLGLLEEKKRVLEKYNNLFIETGKGCPKKSRKALSKKKKKSGQKEHASISDGPTNAVDGGTQTS